MLLRTKLTILAMSLLAVLVLVCIIAIGFLTANFNNQYTNDIIAAKKSLINSQVSRRIEGLTESSKPIVRNRLFKKALMKLDAARIASEIETIERRLIAGKTLSGIVVMSPDRNIIYSTSKEKNIRADDPILTSALENKSSAWGFTKTEGQIPTIAYALPVNNRGKIIGLLVFEYDFSQLLPELATPMQAQVSFSRNKIEIFGEGPVELWNEVSMEYSETGKSNLQILDHNELIFQALTIPLQTIAGRNFGSIILLEDKTESALKDSRTKIILYTILALTSLLAGLILWWQTKKSLLPLSRVVHALDKLASGDLSIKLDEYHQKDEVGSLIEAYTSFRSSFSKSQEQERLLQQQQEEQRQRELEKTRQKAEQERIAHEREQAEASNKEARAKNMEDMTTTFDSEISQVLKTVSNAASDLDTTAKSMNNTAQQTDSQSITVTAAAEQASVNVNIVATAAEELRASISEIGSLMQRSNKVNQEAAARARNTTNLMQDLDQSSQAISQVIDLISDIAEQTNLLALNATIEAARAGDAGKGFAVVATEVKSLATQTADATAKIAEQIQSVQEKVAQASEAMEEIRGTIETSSEMADTVASAVQEQNDTTDEISRNIQEVSKGTQEVSQNIGNVAQGAAETTSASSQIMNISTEMSHNAENLNRVIEGFLTNVRRAAEN